ncbi:MAG: hypothetical protein ABFS14_09715 [Gemmatimonadota bacterium]
MADSDSKEITRTQAVLAVEAIAGGIALVMPVTPSKTGGDGSMADMFFAAPTYWQEVLVLFVLGNVLLAILILIARITNKRARRTER